MSTSQAEESTKSGMKHGRLQPINFRRHISVREETWSWNPIHFIAAGQNTAHEMFQMGSLLAGHNQRGEQERSMSLVISICSPLIFSSASPSFSDHSSSAHWRSELPPHAAEGFEGRYMASRSAPPGKKTFLWDTNWKDKTKPSSALWLPMQPRRGKAEHGLYARNQRACSALKSPGRWQEMSDLLWTVMAGQLQQLLSRKGKATFAVSCCQPWWGW